MLNTTFYKKINQNVWRPKPHIKSVEKFKTKLRDILKRSRSISLNDRLLKLVNGNMKLDKNIRMELRVIIWMQWKKIRKRYTSLRKLGISHRDVYITANCKKRLLSYNAYLCIIERNI